MRGGRPSTAPLALQGIVEPGDVQDGDVVGVELGRVAAAVENGVARQLLHGAVGELGLDRSLVRRSKAASRVVQIPLCTSGPGVR